MLLMAELGMAMDEAQDLAGAVPASAFTAVIISSSEIARFGIWPPRWQIPEG